MVVFYVQSEERPANSCSLGAAGQGAEVSRQLLHIFAKLFKVKVKIKVKVDHVVKVPGSIPLL